jgi:hypothetical protein
MWKITWLGVSDLMALNCSFFAAGAGCAPTAAGRTGPSMGGPDIHSHHLVLGFVRSGCAATIQRVLGRTRENYDGRWRPVCSQELQRK